MYYHPLPSLPASTPRCLLPLSSSPPSCSTSPIYSCPLNVHPAAILPASSRPPEAHQVAPPPQSTLTPYIFSLRSPPLPATALQQLIKQFHRPNLPPTPVFLSRYHTPARSRLPAAPSPPIFSRPLHSPPAVTPLANSNPPGARQTVSPRQSTPAPYTSLLHPPPLPAPALQQLARLPLRPNLLLPPPPPAPALQ